MNLLTLVKNFSASTQPLYYVYNKWYLINSAVFSKSLFTILKQLVVCKGLVAVVGLSQFKSQTSGFLFVRVDIEGQVV